MSDESSLTNVLVISMRAPEFLKEYSRIIIYRGPVVQSDIYSALFRFHYRPVDPMLVKLADIQNVRKQKLVQE